MFWYRSPHCHWPQSQTPLLSLPAPTPPLPMDNSHLVTAQGIYISVVMNFSLSSIYLYGIRDNTPRYSILQTVCNL